MSAKLVAGPIHPDAPEWRGLWERSARRLVHHPDYGVHARFHGGGEPAALGVWRGADLLAVVPFAVRRHRGLLEWRAPLQATFSGPLLASESEAWAAAGRERLWRHLADALERAIPADVDRAEIALPPPADARGFAWRGWRARPLYDYVSRWKTAGEWEGALESALKRQIRKAESGGLHTVVHDRPDSSAISRLSDLFGETMARQGIAAPDALDLRPFADWVLSCGYGALVEIRDGQGATDAAALVTFDAASCLYAVGASSRAADGTGGPSLMHREILREIDRRGLPKCYDWVGANTESISRFKRGFGPGLETGCLVERLSARAAAASVLGALARRLVRGFSST